MAKAVEIKGQRFSKLVALQSEYHTTSGGNKIKYWKCRCDCGNYTTSSTHDLLSGHTKSCGKCIYNVSSKVKYKRIYDAWRMMIARCENPKAQAYHNYGKRGIEVCEEWHDFDVFLKWALSNGYEGTLTIDRIDVNKGYYPQNCRWTTDKVQCNNRRSNHLVEYNGETHTVQEWSEITKMPYSIIASRLYNGWSVQDTFERKPRKDPRRKIVV